MRENLKRDKAYTGRICSSHLWGSQTLCGDQIGLDVKFGYAKKTNRLINCTACLELIKYCKSLDHTQE